VKPRTGNLPILFCGRYGDIQVFRDFLPLEAAEEPHGGHFMLPLVHLLELFQCLIQVEPCFLVPVCKPLEEPSKRSKQKAIFSCQTLFTEKRISYVCHFHKAMAVRGQTAATIIQVVIE
jgi:hypothetical protein